MVKAQGLEHTLFPACICRLQCDSTCMCFKNSEKLFKRFKFVWKRFGALETHPKELDEGSQDICPRQTRGAGQGFARGKSLGSLHKTSHNPVDFLQSIPL